MTESNNFLYFSFRRAPKEANKGDVEVMFTSMYLNLFVVQL